MSVQSSWSFAIVSVVGGRMKRASGYSVRTEELRVVDAGPDRCMNMNASNKPTGRKH